jgi:uncharacterized membrane protein (DUF4010 family)
MGLHEIYQLAIAVGLGLLVGLEREGHQSPIAGIRTYPILTGFGFLTGLLAVPFGGWVPMVGLVVVAAFMVLGNLQMAQKGRAVPGMTSEFAAVVMFTVGLAVARGWNALAVAASGMVLVLLQAKQPLRAFAGRLDDSDRKALAQLVLVGFVLLPAMPDTQMGPYGVLNPREIWLMVVLIVGISLAGYVLYRVLGGGAGSLLSGLLGGLISSTASTVTFSRMTRGAERMAPAAALMVVVASTVVFARVVGEIAFVARDHLWQLAPPLLAMMAGMIVIVLVLRLRVSEQLHAPAPEDPPSDLRSAVLFGALYAVVLVCVAFARRNMDESGLYLVAAVSGLTDMDAITLSSAQLVGRGELEVGTAWRMIMVGGMANLALKGGIVLAAGHRALRRPVLTSFAASLALGGAILAFWP